MFIFQVFQDELKAVKAKEEAEEKRRRYEENVRLGLIKKKGRKSKAQLEKERKLERRRLRREKKEQRRRDRRERREREAREGTSIDSEERRLRKERKRERKEQREREMRERELTGDEKLDKKERKRKLKDPNAVKKPPRQPVSFFQNTWLFHFFLAHHEVMDGVCSMKLHFPIEKNFLVFSSVDREKV